MLIMSIAKQDSAMLSSGWLQGMPLVTMAIPINTPGIKTDDLYDTDMYTGDVEMGVVYADAMGC